MTDNVLRTADELGERLEQGQLDITLKEMPQKVQKLH